MYTFYPDAACLPPLQRPSCSVKARAAGLWRWLVCLLIVLCYTVSLSFLAAPAPIYPKAPKHWWHGLGTFSFLSGGTRERSYGGQDRLFNLNVLRKSQQMHHSRFLLIVGEGDRKDGLVVSFPPHTPFFSWWHWVKPRASASRSSVHLVCYAPSPTRYFRSWMSNLSQKKERALLDTWKKGKEPVLLFLLCPELVLLAVIPCPMKTFQTVQQNQVSLMRLA